MAALSASLEAERAALQGRPVAGTWRVTNELDRKVRVFAHDGSVFVLAPFEARAVQHTVVDQFALDRWTEELRVEPEQDVESFGKVMAFGLGVWFALAWGILGAVVGTPRWWSLGWAALGIALLVGALVDVARARGRASGLRLGDLVITWIRRWGGQQLHLALSLFIGVVLPGAAIFFASDALTLVDIVRDQGVRGDHAVVLTLIGRVMQVVFVATASLTPALLFFLFDREHLETLTNRFMRQIVRFDPTVTTRRDVLAKYQTLMDEAYGRDLRGRILPGRRSPLLLATLIVAMGWTFTLLHGDVQIISERGVSTLFEPRQSAAAFAFLGAYFYGINAILRGYVRKDLRPKTYSTLTVRILIVVVLAWVLELEWHGTTLLLLAFLAGIVPETVLVLIKEFLRTRIRTLGARFSLLDEEPDPLTRLEGIDLYDRARLFDEGVTNVQGLAAHDVVELMLQTRIPVPRILDWVDQAILYLHAGPSHPEDSPRSRAATLATLRAYGIRTATDLDNAFRCAEARKKLEPLTHLVTENGTSDVARLRVIKDTLDDEEWMQNLRRWRRLGNTIPEDLELRVADLLPAARLA